MYSHKLWYKLVAPTLLNCGQKTPYTTIKRNSRGKCNIVPSQGANGRKDEDRREVSRDCEVKLINRTVDKMAVLRPA